MTRGVPVQRRLEIEKRRATVASNILAGLNYRDIAAGLKVSIGTVARDAKIVMERWKSEAVATREEYIATENRRLDTLIRALWDSAQDGKLGAVDRILAIMDRRAKMLGLDAKVGISLSGEITNKLTGDISDLPSVKDMTDDQIDDLIEAILRSRQQAAGTPNGEKAAEPGT